MTASTSCKPEPATSGLIAAGQRWAVAVAFLGAAVYFVASVLVARQRPFWYDEILTVIYSGQPTVAAMWGALANGADGVPPVNHLLVRLFAHLPLTLEVAARLPSALAMAAGLLVTFDCARRLSDGVHGLVAIAFLTCSTLPYYGYEARPYALSFLLSAAALWLWINTDDAKLISPLLVGGVFFVGSWVHFYTVLWLVPYTVWEFLNRDTRRAPSRKLIASYIGVVIALGLLSQQILALHAVLARGFWSPASLRTPTTTFTELFPHVLWPGVCLLIVAALWRHRRADRMVAPMSSYEQLCWLFLLLPVVGFVIGKLVTNAFLPRYFIGLLPAFAVALACLMWRHTGRSSGLALAAVVLFAAYGLANELEHVHYAAAVRPVTATRETERMASLLALEAGLPANRTIVLRSGDLLTLEAHYYAKHPERVVFLLQSGEDAAPPQAPSGTGENRPITYWTSRDMRAHAANATLIDPTPETITDLTRAGHAIEEHYDGVLDIVTVQ